MALVCLAVVPVLGITGYLYFYVSTFYAKTELDSYAVAGGIAEEVLQGIRNVSYDHENYSLFISFMSYLHLRRLKHKTVSILSCLRKCIQLKIEFEYCIG